MDAYPYVGARGSLPPPSGRQKGGGFPVPSPPPPLPPPETSSFPSPSTYYTEQHPKGTSSLGCLNKLIQIVSTCTKLYSNKSEKKLAGGLEPASQFFQRDLSSDARVPELAVFCRDLPSFSMRLGVGGHRGLALKKASATPVHARFPPLEH